MAMAINFSRLPPKALRERHLVDVAGDTPFRSWCRLKQALYRESQGWPCGQGGKPQREIGSRLTTNDAQKGRNFLTPEIFAAAKKRTADREPGDAIEETRLYSNLLTSQTLCFNLFIPQMLDLKLATTIWTTLLPHRVAEVVDVKLEHSPGRGDAVRYTGDRSAFDAFVEYKHSDGSIGIIGIETKYTDTFSETKSDPTDRLEELAASTGLYTVDGWRKLQEMPTQQLWRTHLLAETMRNARHQHVTYMVLHAAGDVECTEVLPACEAALTPVAVAEERFLPMTLEDFVSTARAVVDDKNAEWLNSFYGRYIDWSIVEDQMV